MTEMLIFAQHIMGDYLTLLTGMVVAMLSMLILFALIPKIFSRKDI